MNPTPLSTLTRELFRYGDVEVKQTSKTSFFLKIKLVDPNNGSFVADKIAIYFQTLGITPTVGVCKSFLTCEWEVRI